MLKKNQIKQNQIKQKIKLNFLKFFVKILIKAI